MATLSVKVDVVTNPAVYRRYNIGPYKLPLGKPACTGNIYLCSVFLRLGNA